MNVATVPLNVGTPATICPSGSTGGVAIPVAVSGASATVATLAATASEAVPRGGASWIDTVTGIRPLLGVRVGSQHIEHAGQDRIVDNVRDGGRISVTPDDTRH